MSFTGDLEHLSIVDVVQLLHATRKSGTLTITGRKGSIQLVFSDGFIVSANHFDERLRIGAILVQAGVLPRAELDKALEEQRTAGDRRRPLIATLIESGRVKKDDAFRGLETLIELTIVDILAWKEGTFTLDVGAVAVADEYRYFPEKLHENLQFHTENVLMEALRIYDEKKRDGRLVELEPPERELIEELALSDEAELSLSPGDLGLDDAELPARRIPQVFAPLNDRPRISPHRGAIQEAAPDLPEPARARLADFLESLPARPAVSSGMPLAVILLGADALLTHCLTAVCRHQGFSVFTTTDPEDVGPLAEQHRSKGGVPLLVLDREGLARAGLRPPGLRNLGTVELTEPTAPTAPDGEKIRTVLSRPTRQGNPDRFVPELVRFLESFPALLQGHAREQGGWVAAAARRCAARMQAAASAAAVAQAVLATLAEIGARSLALVVRGGELLSASGAGLYTPGASPAPAPAIRIPLAEAPLLRRAVESGRCLIAPAGDEAVLGSLHPAIGPPTDPIVLLLPLAASGRTVSLVYGDFGPGAGAPPPADLLETFAAQAGTALELVLCRRRLEKPPR
jgi:hypothetical protein